MRGGMLGTGDVGKALGKPFASLGHQVKMGSRDANNPQAKAWASEIGPAASVGSFAEAAQFAELAVLCTLWSGTENALRLAGPQNLAGKVLIDATNPLVCTPGTPPSRALGHTDSGGEQVQRWVPQVRVVKAFNTVGHAHFFKPRFPGGPPDMFICGNDSAAKTTVTDVLTAFGWNHRYWWHRWRSPARTSVCSLGSLRHRHEHLEPRVQIIEEIAVIRKAI